jgi:hypothetical protein
MPYDQIAADPEIAAKPLQNYALGLLIKINQEVAAKHDVHAPL